MSQLLQIATRGSEGVIPDGPLVARMVASRIFGVSPCTVVFSCDQTTDEGRDEHEVWRELGYYFDFDDPASGTYNTLRGGSKDTAVGGPMAAHTFVVSDGGGQQIFEVLVNVEDPEGNTDQAQLNITVQAQDLAFSAGETIAVSDSLNTGNPSEWTSGWDKNVPVGATLSNTLPEWDEMSGKRVMIQRGADFSTVSKQISYGTQNVMITDFGDIADGPAAVKEFWIGVSSDAPGATVADDSDYAGYSGTWIADVTIERLRTGFIYGGMAANQVGLHKLDMDFESELEGGTISWNRTSDWCYTPANNLSPVNVPFSDGFYLSDITLITSTDAATNGTNTSPVNLFVNHGQSNLGVVGCTVRKSDEHNIRTQGGQRNVIHDCDVLGEHIGGAGPKSRVTLRGVGYQQTGLYLGQSRNITTGQDYSTLPYSKYGLVQKCSFSAGDIGDATWGLQFAPTSDSSLHLVEDYLARDIVFLSAVQSPPGDATLAGRWLTSMENTYQGSGTDDTGAQQDLTNIDLGLGTPSLVPTYIDPVAVPTPAAPR